MGLFPKIDLDNKVQEIISDNEEYVLGDIKKDLLFDFSSGEFIFENGAPIEVESKDSVAIWIVKVLNTNYGSYDIYSRSDKKREFGSNIKHIFYGKVQLDYFIKSEIERDIRESLLMHPNIEEIVDFKIERVDRTKLQIDFTVVLNDGQDFRIGGYFTDGKIKIKYI